MIPIPSGVKVWIATGVTDMRRGMNGLSLQVQEGFGRDPHAGDLYVFRGRRGDLIKVLWHDGLGLSLYAKRLERGRFIWPSPADHDHLLIAVPVGAEPATAEHPLPFVYYFDGCRELVRVDPDDHGCHAIPPRLEH